MTKAKFAYAIWPWGAETKEQVIEAFRDIKEVGFEYFESVKTLIDLFYKNNSEFKALTVEYGIKPVSIYFHLNGEKSNDIDDIERKMPFLAENDIHRISVQAPGIFGRPASKEELKYTLNTIQTIGKITRQYDVIPCIHPHYNTTILFENEIDFIMRNTDPEYIAFGPDTAHLAAGCCDPVEIFNRYIERIKFVHIKDLRKSQQVETKGMSEGVEIYSNFMEIGEGDINFPAIFNILKKHNYCGYLTVELDVSRFGNKESARMNMQYIKKNF